MAVEPHQRIVDLVDDRVEVYREPSGGGYADTAVVVGAQPLAPIAFPDIVLTPEDLTSGRI
jgi:hypothetical protein